MARKLFVLFAAACTFTVPGAALGEAPKHPVADQVQTGAASYYSSRFDGRRTASGETFRNDSLTAAHASLPFGTVVLVTCLERGKSVVVRITDRLPAKRAIIDLTQRAAAQLNMLNAGRTRVSVQVIEWGRGGAQALREAAGNVPAAFSAAASSAAAALTDEAR